MNATENTHVWMPTEKGKWRIVSEHKGRITEVRTRTFLADLEPLTEHADARQVEYDSYWDVIGSERPLIQPEAVFFLTTGYEDTPSGRVGFSALRFKKPYRL